MNKIKLGPMRSKYKGNIFEVKDCEVYYPDGSTGVYEFCERPASVSVLAFNTKDELLMIKERRVGYDKNVWFLPGGRVDHEGDTPELAAIRELREETGYTAKTLKLLHKKSPSSTLLWDIYIFVAKDLELDPLPQEKGEFTEPHFVLFEKAVKMALDGSIDNEFISYNIIRFNFLRENKEFDWK